MTTWKNTSLLEYISANTPSGWEDFFNREDVKKQLKYISKFLDAERESKAFFPPLNQVFRVFEETPLESIKATIIAQDPYHNAGAAVGLCFSVGEGNAINPSLRNIYNELEAEGFKVERNGDLTYLPARGVFLINMALTVEAGQPASHSSIWRKFSHLAAEHIAEKTDAYWLLFGRHAHALEKQCLGEVDSDKILKTSHPSPLGATKASAGVPAFTGSGVFTKVPDVDWSYPEN